MEKFNQEPEEKRKPPIAEGEIFDPEKEIGIIKKLPRENKRAAVAEFRDKLAFQKEGLAMTQEMIIKVIRKSPDASPDELYEYVVKAAEFFGFTEKQKKFSKKILEKYAEKHRFIKDLRRNFSDDIKFFEEAFGRKPLGKIEVVEGPISICFRVYDEKDFAYIYSGAFIKKRSPTKKEILESESSGGFLLEENGAPKLKGVIFIEKVDADCDFIEDSREIFFHEERHIINSLFHNKPINGAEYAVEYANNVGRVLTRLKMADSDIEKESAIRQYFMIISKDFEDMAKNEIIAYFFEYNDLDDYLSKKIFLDLTVSRKDGGIYDYYAMEKANIRKYIFKIITKIIGKRYLSSVKKIAEKVFVDEYRSVIREAVDSIKSLYDKKYSKEQIIAMMQTEDLRKWKKVADRLLVAENMKEETG